MGLNLSAEKTVSAQWRIEDPQRTMQSVGWSEFRWGFARNEERKLSSGTRAELMFVYDARVFRPGSSARFC